MGAIPSLEIIMVSDVEAHTLASSSAMMAWVIMSAPAPPYSTGMANEGSSSSTQASKDFWGKVASRSASTAFGAIRSSANFRNVSRNCRWVSVSANAVGSIAPNYSGAAGSPVPPSTCPSPPGTALPGRCPGGEQPLGTRHRSGPVGALSSRRTDRPTLFTPDNWVTPDNWAHLDYDSQHRLTRKVVEAAG